MKNLVRERYLEKIEPFIGKPVIKIIVGMRRVGKSELLKQIKNLIKKDNSFIDTIYINKELRKFDFIKTHQDLNLYIDSLNAKPKTVLFIDEIQEIINWEKAVSSYLAEGMDIYITGSNAHLLSSDLATLLSGRYIEFTVYPLSFMEFCELRDSEESKDEKFQLYLKYGGLPGLHVFDFNEVPSFQYLDAIYQSILLKDVVKRHQIRNVSLLESVTEFIFDNIGNLFNPTNVTNFLKNQKISSSVPTVQSQVKYIGDAFLTYRVKQYDLKGKRYLEVNDKYFVSDLGLRHAILGYKSADISGMLENIVFLELARSDYQICIGRLVNNEVDFICDRRGERTYIQVSYIMSDQKTIDREFSVLEKISDNHPKYVISMDPIIIKRESGVKHINLLHFLEYGLR